MAISRKKTPEGRGMQIDRQRAGIDQRQDGEVNKLLLKNQTDKQLLVASVIRPALIGILLLGAPPAKTEPPPYSDDPYAVEEPFGHPHISPRWSKPHFAHPDSEKRFEEERRRKESLELEGKTEVMEVMGDPEKQIMQKGTTNIVEHFLNPSFRRYLKEKNLEELAKILGVAIKHFDQLYYTENAKGITIKKRPGSREAEVPDDLVIVIEEGKIKKINKEALNKDEFDDWETVVKKILQYTREYDKQEEDSFYEVPEEHEAYESFSFFNLDKFIMEYLALRKAFTPEEKEYLTKSPLFKQFVGRSKKHSEAKGWIIPKPFKLEDERIIIESLSTIEDDYRILLSMMPDGTLLITKDEGETYDRVSPENLFITIYDLQQNDPSKLSPAPDFSSMSSYRPPPLPTVTLPSEEVEHPPKEEKEESPPVLDDTTETLPETTTEISDFDEITLKNTEALKGKEFALVHIHGRPGAKKYDRLLRKASTALKGKILIANMTTVDSEVLAKLSDKPVSLAKTGPTTLILKNGVIVDKFGRIGTETALLKRLEKAGIKGIKIPEKRKKKGLVERLRTNPTKLIDDVLRNPDTLNSLISPEKKEATAKLIQFIKDSKDEPWAKEGIAAMKEDMKNGTFEIPKGTVGGIYDFYSKYFSGMPSSTMLRLGKIAGGFF